MPCVEALKFLSNYVTDLQKGSIGRLVGVCTYSTYALFWSHHLCFIGSALPLKSGYRILANPGELKNLSR
jgi:hypothetical protein